VSESGSASWLWIRVEPAADRDAVIAALFEAGSQGIHEDEGTLVTHFPPGTNLSPVEALVRSADPQALVSTGEAPPRDWTEWRAGVRAHRVGKLSISPPWLAGVSDPMQVIVDPAMAFGTGEHPTTRGVVRLMQTLPEMPPLVADLGAGSAVLSIAAARLGAGRVVAIEIDPDAIGNAEQNVRANGVAGVVHVVEGDAAVLLPLVAPVGLVLANIISSVLVELLPVIRDSLTEGGHAILSGILREERAAMLAVISPAWNVVAEDEEEGWWSVLIARRR
jgi:ribosomal protein L11 methyltransferase